MSEKTLLTLACAAVATGMTRGEYIKHIGVENTYRGELDDEGFLVTFTKDEVVKETWMDAEMFGVVFGDEFEEDGKQQLVGIQRYFAYEHLPASLQATSKPFCVLARKIGAMPESAEKAAGLRKLLEAKDCIVRASLG